MKVLKNVFIQFGIKSIILILFNVFVPCKYIVIYNKTRLLFYFTLECVNPSEDVILIVSWLGAYEWDAHLLHFKYNNIFILNQTFIVSMWII